MKSVSASHQSGFTIVELLIVIVVIAILATISVVAYNGIQTRANNNTTLSGIAQYAKLFQMYATDNSLYPDTGGGYPCLDTTSSGGCGRMSGSGGCAFSGNAPSAPSFLAQLSDYTSKLPTISSQTMTCGGSEIYKGAYIENNTANRKSLMMVVHLKGNADCPGSLSVASLYMRQQSDQTTRCRYQMPSL